MKKKAEKREEVQLWTAFKEGNKTAYAYIYQTYFYKLYNYGKKFTADATLVEDCIQQLFAELWQQKHNLGETASVQNYLYKSFRRKIIRKIQQQRKDLFVQHSVENNPFSISLSHEVHIIHDEIRENQSHFLKEGLRQLSEKQREAIYLKFYEHLSYEEISQVMDLNVKAVYDLIHKGIMKLKKHLKLSDVLTMYSLWVGLLWLLFV